MHLHALQTQSNCWSHRDYEEEQCGARGGWDNETGHEPINFFQNVFNYLFSLKDEHSMLIVNDFQ